MGPAMTSRSKRPPSRPRKPRDNEYAILEREYSGWLVGVYVDYGQEFNSENSRKLGQKLVEMADWIDAQQPRRAGGKAKR